MRTQPTKQTMKQTTLGFLLTLLALLVLSACDTAAPPQAPTLERASDVGFAFHVDPKAQTVTPIAPDTPTALQAQQAEPGKDRPLVQGRDIRYKDFSFQFNAPNKIVVRLRVENITENLDFTQPFAFSLSATSKNLVSATTPLVTDDKLGGDGVLSPGETSKVFPFRATFVEDEPFTFFVDTRAVVVERDVCPIADEALERGIRDALGKQEGTLTCEDLASLETLEPQNIGTVSDLEGLQFAVNLTDLTLGGGGSDVTNLSPLAGLTKLERLSFIFSDSVVDLTPLENLTSLTFLELTGNLVTDVTPLRNLTNLSELRLAENDITSVAGLETLTNLTYLNLFGNDITDIGGLENLTSLTRLLLDNNEIEDISALVANSGLDAGDSVVLVNNPLNAQALDDIEVLRERGVEVSF